MEGLFRFLGTGSSLGVPMIGCKCPVCLSKNPKNSRLRSGSLIKVSGKNILLDAGPDYRMQALVHGIDKIDGFILTHAHYDHMAGIDDLKIYSRFGTRMPCLSLDTTFQEVRFRYSYLFKPTDDDKDYSPFFDWKCITKDSGSNVFEGVAFQHVSFSQTGMQVMGIKIGDLAYISDIKEYDPELISRLQGIKTLIISALRETSSPAHFSLEEACDFAARVGSQKTYLTHIAHEMDCEKVLPPSVFFAYDGLEISFQMEE